MRFSDLFILSYFVLSKVSRFLVFQPQYFQQFQLDPSQWQYFFILYFRVSIVFISEFAWIMLFQQFIFILFFRLFQQLIFISLIKLLLQQFIFIFLIRLLLQKLIFPSLVKLGPQQIIFISLQVQVEPFIQIIYYFTFLPIQRDFQSLYQFQLPYFQQPQHLSKLFIFQFTFLWSFLPHNLNFQLVFLFQRQSPSFLAFQIKPFSQTMFFLQGFISRAFLPCSIALQISFLQVFTPFFKVEARLRLRLQHFKQILQGQYQVNQLVWVGWN